MCKKFYTRTLFNRILVTYKLNKKTRKPLIYLGLRVLYRCIKLD